MENFVTIVVILSTVSASMVSQTTSSTDSSEFMDPREPTFFERQFFTALDMGAKLSQQILPSVIDIKVHIQNLEPLFAFLQVFKHIPFPGKAAHKVDIIEGHDFEVRNKLYPAPQKRVRSKKFLVGRKKPRFLSTKRCE